MAEATDKLNLHLARRAAEEQARSEHPMVRQSMALCRGVVPESQGIAL
jgi:hypothetical protein